MSTTGGPEFEYRGVRGFYLGLDMNARTLWIKGASSHRTKADTDRTVPFSAVRRVSNFRDAGFFVTVEGLEIELNDLAAPVLRVVMTPRDQILWMARFGQVCDLA